MVFGSKLDDIGLNLVYIGNWKRLTTTRRPGKRRKYINV